MSISRRALIAGAVFGPTIIRSGQTHAAEFTYKFATENPDTHPGVVRMREASDALREKTQGRVEIRVFSNSQLGSAQEMLTQIRTGAVDFYPAAAAGLSALVPVASISSIGFAFESYDQVWKAMDGQLGALIRSEIAKTRSVFAQESMWDNGFRQITNSRQPIEKPEDLKGLKLRVPLAKLYTSMFEALGAAPTAISIAELYTSLQTKLVDGQENPLSIIDFFKFYEVQKFCSISNHMWDGWWILTNKRSWDRMPSDIQLVVATALNEAAKKMRADLVKINDSVSHRLKDRGLRINTIADQALFREALSKSGFYTEWRKSYGDEAWLALEVAAGKLA